MRRWILLSLLPFSLFARKVITSGPQETFESPWITGPLLAPSSFVVPRGHFNYEPYLYVVAITGIYNSHWEKQKFESISWANIFQPVVQFGLTGWADFQIAPTLNYNYTDHQAKWTFGDLPLELNIQLYTPPATDQWTPVIKLVLKEILPTGKYNHLNPKKRETDAGGGGSFETLLGVVLGKMFYFGDVYFLNSRLLLQYSLPAAARLKGFNSYGGGFGTNARFYPSQNFLADFAIELGLARNWVFACDLVGIWYGKSHFTGSPGVDPLGQPAPLGRPSFGVQYSLAPAIEYNWNARLGIIGGGWFTFAGRESISFWSTVLAINYYQ